MDQWYKQEIFTEVLTISGRWGCHATSLTQARCARSSLATFPVNASYTATQKYYCTPKQEESSVTKKAFPLIVMTLCSLVPIVQYQFSIFVGISSFSTVLTWLTSIFGRKKEKKKHWKTEIILTRFRRELVFYNPYWLLVTEPTTNRNQSKYRFVNGANTEILL